MGTVFEGIAVAGIVVPRRRDAGDAAEGPGLPVNNLEAAWGGGLGKARLHPLQKVWRSSAIWVSHWICSYMDVYLPWNLH